MFAEGKAAPSNSDLKPLYDDILNGLATQVILGYGPRIKEEQLVKWVPRAFNSVADLLCELGMFADSSLDNHRVFLDSRCHLNLHFS